MTSPQPALALNRSSWRAALFGVSLLLHALLAYLFLLAQPRAADSQQQQTSTELVWIRAAPPRPVALPSPVPAPVVVARARTVRTRTTRVVKHERDPGAAPVPAPAAEQAKAVEPATPAFDREAALAAARTIATEPEPWQAGMALARPAPRPVYSETKEQKLGRMIAGAKRGNCIGPNAPIGNLLTPLGWLLDKKNGGCKF